MMIDLSDVWRNSVLKPLLWPFLGVLRELALYLPTPPIRVGRVLRQIKCRAVLCQEYEYPRFDICVVVGRLLRIPVFATFQGGDYQRSRIERWSRPLTLRGCSGLIIGASTEIARVRSRYGVPVSKLARVGNPINTGLWRPADQDRARRALGIPAEAMVVAWHGRISVWKKGLDILIEAWAELTAQHVDVDLRLILIGGGEDAPWLAERIESLGPRGIHWHAVYTLDQLMIRDCLSAADVYAFPSRHEGFAVALLEAMACGLPVAAADASAVVDALEKASAQAAWSSLVKTRPPWEQLYGGCS